MIASVVGLQCLLIRHSIDNTRRGKSCGIRNLPLTCIIRRQSRDLVAGSHTQLTESTCSLGDLDVELVKGQLADECALYPLCFGARAARLDACYDGRLGL